MPPYPFNSTTGQGKFCTWRCPGRTAVSWYDRLIKDIAPKRQTLVLTGKDASPRHLCWLPPLCSTEHMCSITQQLIALEVSGDLNSFLIQRCPNSRDAASDVLQCKALWPSAHGFSVCAPFFTPRRKKGRESHKTGQRCCDIAGSNCSALCYIQSNVVQLLLVMEDPYPVGQLHLMKSPGLKKHFWY